MTRERRLQHGTACSVSRSTAVRTATARCRATTSPGSSTAGGWPTTGTCVGVRSAAGVVNNRAYRQSSPDVIPSLCKLQPRRLPISAAFITARCYASAVLAVSVRPFVRLSVTSRSSTKTAKRRITETTPHNSPGTLVFWCQRSPRNSTGVTPYEGAKRRCGGSKSATFDK